MTSGAVGDFPPAAQNMLSIACRNADRLSALVNNFLDSEKIAQSGMQFDLQPQALMPLLCGAMEDMQAFAQSYRVKIAIARVEPAAIINVDAERFMQVMNNLLSNAVKFSPSNGVVEIGARIDAAQCLIEVRDHGPGIPKEFTTRMFGRFTQADGSDARAKDGTGLGLAITKALVEGMGGRVRHECPASGGTKMIVEWPLANLCILGGNFGTEHSS
jgi:signal transduction histidine kinase